MTPEQAQQLDKIAKRKHNRIAVKIFQGTGKGVVAAMYGTLSISSNGLSWLLSSESSYTYIFITDAIKIGTEDNRKTVRLILAGKRLTKTCINKHAALIDERRQEYPPTQEPTP